MLCLRSMYRHLEDDLQLYDPVCLWSSSLHSAVSLLNKSWQPNRYRHPCLSFDHFFYPYQLPPTPYLRHFLYWRVMEFMFQLIVLLSKEAGILLTWVSSSRHAFNALDRWLVFIGFAFDEGVASSSAPFYPIYKQHFPLIFLYFILADLWERDRRPFSLALPPSAYLSLSLKSSRRPSY